MQGNDRAAPASGDPRITDLRPGRCELCDEVVVNLQRGKVRVQVDIDQVTAFKPVQEGDTIVAFEPVLVNQNHLRTCTERQEVRGQLEAIPARAKQAEQVEDNVHLAEAIRSMHRRGEDGKVVRPDPGTTDVQIESSGGGSVIGKPRGNEPHAR
jgi:hypothetical protein